MEEREGREEATEETGGREGTRGHGSYFVICSVKNNPGPLFNVYPYSCNTKLH
jgi:hypothetical protein